MGVNAHWTLDCCGKEDYDGPIVSVCTRYWPRGGGFFAYDATTGEMEENEDRPNIKPSAHCEIIIDDIEPDHTISLVEKQFEANTEDEVKRDVEMWANQQYGRIVEVLKREFRKEPTDA